MLLFLATVLSLSVEASTLQVGHNSGAIESDFNLFTHGTEGGAFRAVRDARARVDDYDRRNRSAMGASGDPRSS